LPGRPKEPGPPGPENTNARNQKSFRIFRNQSSTEGTEPGHILGTIEKSGAGKKGRTGKEEAGIEKRKKHSGLESQGGRDKSRKKISSKKRYPLGN